MAYRRRRTTRARSSGYRTRGRSTGRRRSRRRTTARRVQTLRIEVVGPGGGVATSALTLGKKGTRPVRARY